MDATKRQHFLVQAPVKPLDIDGINVAITGTILFAISAAVLGYYWPFLLKHGIEWWLWVALTGTGLGVIGTFYCWERRKCRLAGNKPELKTPAQRAIEKQQKTNNPTE